MIFAIRSWLRDSAKDYVGRAAVGLVFGYGIAALVSFLFETVRSNFSDGSSAPGQISAVAFLLPWFAFIAASMQSNSTGDAIKRLIVAFGVVAALVVLYTVYTWI